MKITEVTSRKAPRVFLGGTCNESTWREELIPLLKEANIDFFNPVVPDWNEQAYQTELRERETCDYVLYVITPKMTGVYSIAEAVDDSNKRPKKTIFCFLGEDVDGDVQLTFDKGQTKSLTAVGKMVQQNGALWVADLQGVVKALA